MNVIAKALTDPPQPATTPTLSAAPGSALAAQAAGTTSAR